MPEFEKQLLKTLYRKDCPDTEILGEFHLGMVSGKHAKLIEDHLSHCIHCSAEINQLDGFLGDLARETEEKTLGKIKKIVATLVKEGLPRQILDGVKNGFTGGTDFRTAEPAFALRGKANDTILFKAGDTQVIIEVKNDPDKPGFKTLFGLIVGIQCSDFKVDLLPDNGKIKSIDVNYQGNFVISGVSPGKYSITIKGQETEITVANVKV